MRGDQLRDAFERRRNDDRRGRRRRWAAQGLRVAVIAQHREVIELAAGELSDRERLDRKTKRPQDSLLPTLRAFSVLASNNQQRLAGCRRNLEFGNIIEMPSCQRGRFVRKRNGFWICKTTDAFE